MRIARKLRRSIERLGPYPSLLIVAVPLAIAEPLKVAAMLVLGGGHWMVGVIVMICAYATSLFITERLFVIAKPNLLTLPWFAAAWSWFVAVRDKALRWITPIFLRRIDRTLMRRIVSVLEETKSPVTAVALAAVHAEVFASG